MAKIQISTDTELPADVVLAAITARPRGSSVTCSER